MGILRGSDLKQNIGDRVDIFLQNKRKLTSIVVFCRPCSCTWRRLANSEGFAVGHVGVQRRTQTLQNRLYSPFTVARTTKYSNRGKLTFVLKKNINIIPIFCFKYEPSNIPIQILQISNRLSGPLCF